MKTVLITIFDSNMARNILRTDVFAILKKNPDTKLVVLVPPVKKEAYQKEFGGENVVIDFLPQVKPTRLENFAFFVCHHSIATHTARQIIEGGWTASEGRLRLDKYLLARLTLFLGQFKIYRKVVRRLLSYFFKEGVFSEVLLRYKPDLIFSPTIYSENDIRLLKVAKKKKIKTVGMIKSWDNLSSKDFLLIPPDQLIVHSELIMEEASKCSDYQKDNIFVSGIPQFDVYTQPNYTLSKEEFFKQFNLDPGKKLILYAAVGSWLFPGERKAITDLAQVIRENKLTHPSQLLVRLHPAYLSEDEHLKNIPGLVLHRPGRPDLGVKDILRSSWEFDQEETRILASTIRWSDVSINCGSTMTIETAYFDTPIINIDFDETPKPYWQSIHRVYMREHYLPLVESGGIRFPKNKEELISDINNYLKNKSLDREGRARIVREQCYRADGQAGRRIAEHILKYV